MAKPRQHLTRAPIKEAVIDFRVRPRKGISAASFVPLKERLAGEYPTSSPIRSVEARFGVRDGRPLTSQVESELGWMLHSADGTARVQLRTNGFTFNKLEPYTTWEEVFGESMRLWQIYAETAQPQEIGRLAVRYINRLRLPKPLELSEYLEGSPVVPPLIPQQIEEFLSRIVVRDPDREASAIITQALEPPVGEEAVSVLLDIDAFRAGVLTPGESDVIQAVFENLRALKNLIFYASITERTVEQYA